MTVAIIISLYLIFTPHFTAVIEENAEYFDIEPALVYAVVKAESGYRADAVSPKGALGLMQLMPDTAKWIFDELNYKHNGDIDFKAFILRPEVNVLLATAYLSYLQYRFDSQTLAIIAYNAGEGRVAKWLEEGIKLPQDIPFAETKKYYRRVTSYQRVYSVLNYVDVN